MTGIDESRFQVDGSLADYRPVAVVFIAVAVVMAFVNLMPAVTVPFYQDDFHKMWLYDSWGGDYLLALSQQGFEVGFRPLGYVIRLFLWDFLGPDPLMHHVFIAACYVLVALIAARAAMLVGGTKLHGALALMFFLGAIIPRQWVYSWVAFEPADIFVLLTFLLTIEAAYRGWSSTRAAVAVLLCSALALFTKESGAAAPLGVVLIAALLYKRLSRTQLISLIGGEVLLLAAYGIVYRAVAASRYLSLPQTEFSLEQVVDVAKGVIYAAGGPMTAVYLSVRKYGLDLPVAILFAILALIGVGWMILSAASSSPKGLVDWLRKRAMFVVAAVVLAGVSVSPYLPGRWFERRMLLPAFAVGVVMWSRLLGDAYLQKSKGTSWLAGGAVLVLLAGFSGGAPLTEIDPGIGSLSTKVETGRWMRSAVARADSAGLDKLCLFGFPDEGGAIRVGNAQSLVKYESRERMRAPAYSDSVARNRKRVMRGENCAAALIYDPEARVPAPIRMEWGEKEGVR